MPKRRPAGAAPVSADDSPPPDHGLITSISLPPDALVPDAETGAATHEEYDRYFRIAREQTGLLPWTQTCLELNQRLLDDLQSSRLDPEDQRDILRGCLLVLQVTLSRWADAAASSEVDEGEPHHGQ